MARQDIQKLQKYSREGIRRLAVKAIVDQNEDKVEHLVKILTMRREGTSYRKIASELGLSSQETIRYWLKKIQKLDDQKE